MMTEQPPLLSIAQQVLKLETILTVNRTPNINRFGFKILDRWALNSPEKLKALESGQGGVTSLLMRLGQQQTLEYNILMNSKSQVQMANGLTEHEILTMHQVDTEL